MNTDLTTAFLRWALVRSALARGWWLVTAVYLVVVAELRPAELVLVGVFQGVTVLAAEVPAGVLADAVSRRLALVTAHVAMGTGMALTGFVTDYPLVVLTQCLWGLGWALSSGADVAWITDELDRPDRIDRVLAAQAGAELRGTVLGIVAFGALAWATTLAATMVVAGVTMVALGLGGVARWPETRFTSVPVGRRRAEAAAILRQGLAGARADRVILLVLAANLLLHGGEEGFGRLFERRLLTLGLTTDPDPILWFAAVALVAAALGAATLRLVEAAIDGTHVARRAYVGAGGVGVAGLLVLAHAPDAATGVAGALLMRGVASPTTRVAATILVNRRATAGSRATMHSFLSQTENAGEVVFGLGLAAVAVAGTPTATLTGSAALLAGASLLVHHSRDRP